MKTLIVAVLAMSSFSVQANQITDYMGKAVRGELKQVTQYVNNDAMRTGLGRVTMSREQHAKMMERQFELSDTRVIDKPMRTIGTGASPEQIKRAKERAEQRKKQRANKY